MRYNRCVNKTHSAFFFIGGFDILVGLAFFVLGLFTQIYILTLPVLGLWYLLCGVGILFWRKEAMKALLCGGIFLSILWMVNELILDLSPGDSILNPRIPRGLFVGFIVFFPLLCNWIVYKKWASWPS